MKRYIYILMGILGFVPIWAQQSDYYYYYKGERIYLDVDSTHLHVISTDELEPQDASLSRAARYRISSSVKSRTYSELVPLQKQRLVTTTPTHYSTLELSVGMDASLYNATIKIPDSGRRHQRQPRGLRRSYDPQGSCCSAVPARSDPQTQTDGAPE